MPRPPPRVVATVGFVSSSGSERPAVGDRYHTQTGLLARLSFNDTAAAADLLARAPSPLDREILEALGRVADPDVGLAALVRLIDAETARRGSGRAGAGGADGDLLSALHADPPARDRLLAVLGASVALGEHLARHPEHWRALSGPDATARPDAGTLRERLLHAVGADPAADAPVAADAGPATLMALRVAYRRHLLYLAARDLTGVATLDEVTAELADLAAAAIDAALAIGRAEVGTEHECSQYFSPPSHLYDLVSGEKIRSDLNFLDEAKLLDDLCAQLFINPLGKSAPYPLPGEFCESFIGGLSLTEFTGKVILELAEMKLTSSGDSL